MNNHVLCNYAIRRRHSHNKLPPDSTYKAASLFRKAVLLADSQYFLCQFPGSTKAFCCCGSHPTGISVRMHRGCPAALSTRPSVPCTAHHKSSYHSGKQLSSLQYLFCFLMQVTYYTFQLNLCPSTTPRGTKTAQCSQNNYSSDFLLENYVHSRQDKACLDFIIT